MTDSEQADQHFELALDAYYDESRPRLAIKHLRKAIRLMPERAGYCSALGQILHEQGKRRSAEQYYRRALALDYEDTRALFGLGVLLQQRVDDQEAMYLYFRHLYLER